MGREIQARAFALRTEKNSKINRSCGEPSLKSLHKTIRDNSATYRLSIEICTD